MGGGNRQREREQEEALRRAQEEANRRAREAEERANTVINLASQSDPLTDRLRARDMSWLDWEDQKEGPLDVSKAPLGPALSLYDRAVNRREGEKMGIGALRMGAQASNPNLAGLLQRQSEDRRQQEAAGDLEGAVRMKSAEVNQSVLPLAGFDQSRRMGLASLAAGREAGAFGNVNSAMGNYSQFLTRPRQPSFWQNLLLTGIGGASSVASGMASGGTGFFR